MRILDRALQFGGGSEAWVWRSLVVSNFRWGFRPGVESRPLTFISKTTFDHDDWFPLAQEKIEIINIGIHTPAHDHGTLKPVLLRAVQGRPRQPAWLRPVLLIVYSCINTYIPWGAPRKKIIYIYIYSPRYTLKNGHTRNTTELRGRNKMNQIKTAHKPAQFYVDVRQIISCHPWQRLFSGGVEGWPGRRVRRTFLTHSRLYST